MGMAHIGNHKMDPETEEFQNDATTFIRRMLNDIKEVLPYGHVTYSPMFGFYPQQLPESFIVLRQVGSVIPRPARPGNRSFSSIFKEVAIFNHQSVLLEQWPQYISLFIEYLRVCIEHVRNSANAQLLAPNPLFNANTTRLSTQRSTWESYANEWEDAIGKWTKFLNLFNMVYGFVCQRDFVNALITLVQYSPSCIKFWRYFWDRLIFSGNISHQRYTMFQRLLNKDILPGLINPDNSQYTLQLNYCRRGLQHTVDELQDIILRNHYRDTTGWFDGRLFHREAVNEALWFTGITLMPDERLIGEECRRIANYQNRHEMAVYNNFVRFSQR